MRAVMLAVVRAVTRAVVLAVVRAVTRAVVLVLRVKHKPRSVNDRHCLGLGCSVLFKDPGMLLLLLQILDLAGCLDQIYQRSHLLI